MATDATGTPTSLGIPTYNINVDAPSGNGFNAAMSEIDTLLQARATLASPAFTGTPTSPTPGGSDNSTNIATTAFVKGQGYALLASPAFTGTPTAPTPATGDNSTNVATTAFVKAQGYVTSSPVTSVFGRVGAVSPQAGDYLASQVTNAADKASGSNQVFTALVAAPSHLGVAVNASAALGATITPRVDTANHYTQMITSGGGTVTISNPTVQPTGTQSGLLTIQIGNSGGSGETLSWGTAYTFSSWSKPASVAPGGLVFLVFAWDPVNAVWRAIGSF